MLFKRKAKRIPAERRTVPQPEGITQKGFGTEMPPQKCLVDIYFDQKGFPGQAGAFYDFYEMAQWCSPKGTPYRNWKLLAGDWIFSYEQEQKLRKRLRENMLAGTVRPSI
ncbi:hypothetical protein PQ469_14160 [Mucilaginibacter sp. KACC 22773]|uniref:hypothetical protein n=1 Tax=Mucilaginibacter sp. KACC 22773 TaxID=3025671 RepID=UPI002366F998|nr:hypothetical protein [Mucilaginibacter sp. KACC 22773]WDF81151.1 hypothetical protein PQ469_14160 [Mucilaginibacter sp. KACC 22773]